MVDNTWIEKIMNLLKKEPAFQEEIRTILKNPDRAILTGYLRCLVDLGKIRSKDRGRAKVYFLKKESSKRNLKGKWIKLNSEK